MKLDIKPAVLSGSRPAQATTSASIVGQPRDRRLYLTVMSTIRWLHIYLSMFGFTALVFFAITGITLNHAAWFGLEGEHVQDVTGKLDTKLLSPGGEESSIDKLMIVEALRNEHRLSGAVAEFRTDESECFVSFKGPGFAADAFITRESGEYQLSIARHGVVAIMNDLHKGRDSGMAWSVLIDVSAILMTLSSVTGMLLLIYLKRIRFSGFMTAIVGTVVLIAVYKWLVP
ncbi:MAG: PepSY-associated TM helix domain-containing protein [Planctomycetota bacterium]